LLKSVALKFFSLLGSSSSSSVDASSFGCVVILPLYLMLNVVISSVIIGTFKSVCKTLLAKYHGTSAYRKLQRAQQIKWQKKDNKTNSVDNLEIKIMHIVLIFICTVNCIK
jgi:hypothetical protein